MMALLLVAAVGCDKSDQELDGEVVETRARIVNNLAVDGCSWHFEVTNRDSSKITSLVPTLATEPTVKSAVPKWGTEDAYSFINVNLKYRRAGTSREIPCGFGTMQDMDEVEVVEVRAVE